LSERLSQRQAEELAEVATLTEANLTQLSERLTKHMSAELGTTRDAIRQQSDRSTRCYGSQQSALEQQQATVDALKRLSLKDLNRSRRG
jgi:tRNA U34 5-carboxymethylaminomethyl modifying GTPase MnmE/TrmE